MHFPDDGPENVHAAWRMAVARQAAMAYTGNRNVAALAVAGSVGAGIADRFSDLELDCYWVSPPADADRLAPVRALAGELTALWDYDQDDEEWSEDYRVGELDITVSNFLVSSVERFLDDVVLRASTDPVRHMRLAALQRSRPLLGAQQMASWRTRADAFPGILVAALVEQALAPAALRGWAARDALVSRGDDLAVSDLLSRAGHAVVRAVLALNRSYLPHGQLKWQHHLITGLRLAPAQLAERLKSMSADPPADALRAAEALLAETADLAEEHSDADISAFRETLSERRRVIDPPPPGPERPAPSPLLGRSAERHAGGRGTGEPRRAFLVQQFHLGAAQARQAAQYPLALGLLKVPEVPVPVGEGSELRLVKLDRGGRIDHVEPVPFVDRLPPHDSPAPVAQLKEVVEPAGAGDVHLNRVHGRPLLDLHLGLRDRPVPSDVAAEAAEEVRDVHAVLEPGPADGDEVGVRPLEPGSGHPPVVMPDPRELFPPSRVP